MENLYEILGVDADAVAEEIRKAYIRLAKVYHPDKSNKDTEKTADNTENHSNSNSISSSSSSSDSEIKGDSHKMFVKINHAWKILSNGSLRAEFDVKWKERCLHQTFPIQDNVPFSEFEFCEEEGVFLHSCRCGSDYVLSETEAELYYDLVCCATCSLTIQVEYKKT